MLYRYFYLLTVILKILANQKQAHFSRENTCPGKQVSSSKCTVQSIGRSKIHCGMLCSQVDYCVSFKWDKNLQSCQICREVMSSDCSNTVLDSAIAYRLPCENGGKWSPDGHSCSCPPNYVGVRCQTYSFAEGSPPTSKIGAPNIWYRQICTTESTFCSSSNFRGCYDGLCLCEIGYYHSVSTDTCLRTCGKNKRLTAFEKYHGYYIEGSDAKCVAFSYVASCVNQCGDNGAAMTCDFMKVTSQNRPTIKPMKISSNGFTCCHQQVTWLDVNSRFRKIDNNAIHLQKKCK